MLREIVTKFVNKKVDVGTKGGKVLIGTLTFLSTNDDYVLITSQKFEGGTHFERIVGIEDIEFIGEEK